MCNRLAQHLAAIEAAKPAEPGKGDLCYAVAMFRMKKGSKWRPPSINAIPPITAGRFAYIWIPSFSLAASCCEAAEFNAGALRYAAKPRKRLKSWCVVVRMLYDHDETARPVDFTEGGGA